MAVEKTKIQEALKARGLTETMADVFSFETEDQMKTSLDLIAPKTSITIPDELTDVNLKTLLTKIGTTDEVATSLILKYGDKRVGDAKKKWDAEHKTSNPPDGTTDLTGLITKTVQEAIKPFSEKITAIESEKAKAAREEKIKGLLKAELPEKLHSLVLGNIPADADEAKIKAIIGETKSTLTGLGLKDIGVPGGGDGTGGEATAKAEVEAWAKSREKKETHVKTKN